MGEKAGGLGLGPVNPMTIENPTAIEEEKDGRFGDEELTRRERLRRVWHYFGKDVRKRRRKLEELADAQALLSPQL